MAYNLTNGSAVKDNDILLYHQLKGAGFKVIKKQINAKNTGTTLIFTTDNNGKRFYPMFARAYISAANTVTLVPTISIGANNPSYNDILAGSALTGMVGVNNMTNFNLLGLMNSVGPNTGVYVNVTVGATATTCDIDVVLFGDYE